MQCGTISATSMAGFGLSLSAVTIARIWSSNICVYNIQTSARPILSRISGAGLHLAFLQVVNAEIDWNVLVAVGSVPLQQRYIADYTANNVHRKPGNGGFFFSCYLGSYWEMLFDDAMVGAHTGTLKKRPLDAVCTRSHTHIARTLL